MNGVITKDPTNSKFFLVIADGRYAYGARLLNEAWRALNKIDGNVAVSVDGDGKIIIDGREIGHMVSWNGEPCSPSSDAAWSIRTTSGRPGRLGRALKKAVDENRLSAEEATAWVRKYLGEDSATDLQALLDDAGDQSDDLAELLKRHLLQNDLPW